MPPSIISYIPALHRGYIDFFKKYPGATLYILSTAFVRESPRMDRDIRALTPEEIKILISALGIFSNVAILDEKNIKDLLTSDAAIIMPDDEVNRKFAEDHLAAIGAATALGGITAPQKITFVPTFLRWDRKISTTEFEVAPDRIISEDEFDREMIAQATEESKKSPDWWRQIGGILLRDKKPILMTHNTALPSEYTLNALGDPRSNFDASDAQYKDLGKFIHAEAYLIAQAAKQGISTEGMTLYTTTFPCPACAKSVAMAGIKEVYYAKGYSLLDAEDILKAFGVKLVMVK